MAALLIALAVMAIVMSVAMPVWRHEAQREKEAELIWRGEQYARAIALFRAKNAQNPNLLPPSIDVLVDGRFLRKKYKDPMTKDGEFVPMQFGQQTPGASPNPPNPGRGNPPPNPSRGSFPQNPSRGNFPPMQQPGSSMAVGGIAGVRSKSQDTSIRSYRGQTRYDQWAFLYTNVPRPGGAMPMANTEDGRGRSGNPPFPGSGTGPRGTGPRGTGPRGNPQGGFNPPGSGFPPPPPPPPPPGRRGGGGPGGRGPGL